MRHLARLLAHPGREIHVLDLVAAEAGNPIPADDELPPPTSRSGTPARCSTPSEGRPTAGDSPRSTTTSNKRGPSATTYREAQADAERDFLVRELSRAVGLGGRDRRAGSASERARSGVTRAIRQAMARINEHNAELGQHLQRAIRTGTYCSYLPDTRVPAHWDI